MAMNHTVDFWKPLVDLAVDKSLLVALLGPRINRRAVRDMVFDEVRMRGDESRGSVSGHDEDIVLLRMP
jgi:hypothetical protein